MTVPRDGGRRPADRDDAPPVRRRLRAPAGLALLVGTLSACGSGGVDLPAGRYAYEASHPTPGGGDTIHLEGTLHLDSVTPDTIEGHWEVQQLHPELRAMVDASGDRWLTARPTYFGTIRHSIRRIGGALACSGSYVWVADGGEEESTPLTCSVTPAE